MNTDDRMSGCWIGLLLSAALVLGACGSGSSEATPTEDLESSADALPLDDGAGALDDDALDDDALDDDASDDDALDDTAPDDDALDDDASGTVSSGGDFNAAEFDNLSDLEGVELTPEVFEQLKTNEVSRAAIIEEMAAQGLDGEEAECFLDEVSAGLFIAFGRGEQPNDAQFGELIGLLDTCGIAFGA